jgi:membrane protease YdiL (CAAX protease family)
LDGALFLGGSGLGAIAATLVAARRGLLGASRPLRFASAAREVVLTLILLAITELLIVGVFLLRSTAPTTPIGLLPSAVAQALLSTLAAAPFVVAALARSEGLDGLGLSGASFRGSMLLGIVLAAIVATFGRLSGVMRPPLPESVAPFVAAFSVGIAEELIWRGYAQQRLAAWLGDRAGWLTTSALFSLWHIPQRIVVARLQLVELLSSLVTVFVFGLLFGWIMRKTQHIAAPALLHAFLDWAERA